LVLFLTTLYPYSLKFIGVHKKFYMPYAIT
jgi:hypothetical protein